MIDERRVAQRSIPEKTQDRYQALVVWEVNMRSFLFDQEFLQRCIEYYSMCAEWITSVICDRKRYLLMVAMDMIVAVVLIYHYQTHLLCHLLGYQSSLLMIWLSFLFSVLSECNIFVCIDN